MNSWWKYDQRKNAPGMRLAAFEVATYPRPAKRPLDYVVQACVDVALIVAAFGSIVYVTG